MSGLVEATHTRHPVTNQEDVGHIRRVVGTLSRMTGASEAEVGRTELSVTELATNLLRHAKPGGFILVRPLVTGACRGVEILSVDSGPGTYDVGTYTTRGSMRPGGGGLASIEGSSTNFDIYSRPGKGTVVLSRHYFGDAPKSGDLDMGGVSIARPGETVSGDGWATHTSPSERSVLIVDGIGHGPGARKAAEAGIACLGNGYKGDLEEYVRQANTAMRKTHGGVLGLAHFDLIQSRVKFVGVGNIEGRMFHPNRDVTLLSRHGSVGMSIDPPATRIITEVWAPGAVMILHSDGVRIKHESVMYNGLLQRDPAVIAAVALRDGLRGTDDATVVVVKDTRRATS